MDDDLEGKMFLVREFQVHPEILETQGDPSAPKMRMVRLQVLSEVGATDNLMASPQMWLKPEDARKLGQQLIQAANAARGQDIESSGTKKQH